MSKKHDLSDWLNHGIDFQSRTICLGGGSKDNEVNAVMAEPVIKALMAMNWQSKKPITLIINSPGGELYSGMAIYDAILASKAPVHGLAIGAAMSVAATIFQACSKRAMTQNARLMHHASSWSVNDETRNLHRWAEEAARWEQWDFDQLEKIMDDRELGKILLQGDAFLTAEDALSLGFCDQIVGRK